MASFMRPFESQAYAVFRIVTGLLFLWHGMPEAVRLPRADAARVQPAGVHPLRGRPDRADRRRARDDRPVHELGRVPVQRPDGRSPTGWRTASASTVRSRSSRASTRRARGPVLLRVPVHLRARRRHLERRRNTFLVAPASFASERIGDGSHGGQWRGLDRAPLGFRRLGTFRVSKLSGFGFEPGIYTVACPAPRFVSSIGN